MNQIIVWEPRWHDRVVLVADYKLAEHNQIVIKHHDFPNPLYLSGKRAREFPLEQMATKSGRTMGVRAIPIDEITKEMV